MKGRAKMLVEKD